MYRQPLGRLETLRFKYFIHHRLIRNKFLDKPAQESTKMEKIAHNPPVYPSVCDRDLVVVALGTPELLPRSTANDKMYQHQLQKPPSQVMVLAKKFNCFFVDRTRMRSCKPFVIDGYQVGLITPEVMDKLKTYPDVFQCSEHFIALSPSLADYESRSQALDVVLREFRRNQTFVTLRGWREECFEVRVDLGDVSLMRMERAATCLFGIRQFGVDINGYVNHPEKGLCIWLQKRSPTKARWANFWDNIVGGGLSVGYSVIETAHKEAFEEASIPDNLLQNLQAAGSVSIFFESERGLSPNTEFVYDLELPIDFIPKNQDGEVSEFHLFPVKEAVDVILSPKFKTTSCPVALDFLIRQGVINDKNEFDLASLKTLLHIPLTDFYRKIDKSDNLV